MTVGKVYRTEREVRRWGYMDNDSMSPGTGESLAGAGMTGGYAMGRGERVNGSVEAWIIRTLSWCADVGFLIFVGQWVRSWSSDLGGHRQDRCSSTDRAPRDRQTCSQTCSWPSEQRLDSGSEDGAAGVAIFREGATS